MLTTEQIYQNKLSFMKLLSKLNVDLTDYTKYLDSIDYFNKPASAQYNRAYAGGLCQNALILYNELGQLCNAYFPGRYTEEDIIKVALFKDLYRAVMYEEYERNVKNEETGNWETVKAYRTKTERPTFGDLGFSSYMIAKYFFTFTDEQIEAIVHSKATDGFTNDIHDILRSYPLVTLTRMADSVTSYLV